MPTSKTPPDRDPRPLAGQITFEPWDFEALGPQHCKNSEANEYRLKARRKLLALGKAWSKEEARADFDVRSSIHNPHAFNGKKVDRLWAYLARTKAQKSELRKVLGRDLAKDLNAAYRNAYLCVGIEYDALDVSLRIHPDAWYDGQNLLNRVKQEGARPLLNLLNELDGFTLRLHDWKGRWPLGSLSIDALEREVLKYYQPGELGFVVERRWPIPTEIAAREAVLQADIPAELQQQWARLVPLFQYLAWSESSNFLFSS